MTAAISNPASGNACEMTIPPALEEPGRIAIVSGNPHSPELTSMLKHTLIHPKINEILGRAGHHSKVLIADGNYPAWNTLGPNAELVSLNLSPGLVSCTDVLKALATAIPIEAANTMGIPADDPYALQGDPPIWDDYRQIFIEESLDVKLAPIPKWEFYDAVASRDHVLTIQTAEQALWANLLLTIGVRKPGT
jgi:L-fucose mutarotase